MKFFSLDSPLMNVLGKMADLMWLNILTMICCIPIVTAGASLTAMNYMALKIVRNEECYITRGFFKSFKENFKQGTLIWLLLLLVVAVFAGDFYIINETEIELHSIFKTIILIAVVFAVFTAMYVFPVLAKFDNTVMRTIKNAFVMSVLQFPKTMLMIVMYVLPPILCVFFIQLFPVVFLFGLSVPAFVSALLYNKFFQKLEDQIAAENAQKGEASEETEGETEALEDERIFKDELEEDISQ